ncbi:MAG TPA: hypothetical protein K8V90_07720 [Romboutsia timonensis]|uniref:Secreted protein n=1 Tax=Romboutsia timonensis TaxID=1776391 RepID=A0A921T0A8_9FIRM|nr:hypothetical protein [Romboutsia timonensis]
MKKFIAFIVILVCLFPLKNFLLNTTSDEYNTNKKEDSKKTNPQTFSSKENESLLVDIGEKEYIVSVDSNSKEVVINENIYDSDKYIKINYEELVPMLDDVKDYKDLSIPEYISLYNKFSSHMDTNMSYGELLSLVSNININDLKSNYSELVKIAKNNS